MIFQDAITSTGMKSLSPLATKVVKHPGYARVPTKMFSQFGLANYKPGIQCYIKIVTFSLRYKYE